MSETPESNRPSLPWSTWVPPSSEIGPDSPLDRLRKEAYRFDFFQAVRVLEWWAAQHNVAANSVDESVTRGVGSDNTPSQEIVRFHAWPSLSHPSADIQSAYQATTTTAETTSPAEPRAWQMTVSFLGLFGPQGVLPQHYTQMVIDRMRRKDATLRDFLDLFNHRLISLFYRAWAKYRLPMAFERQPTAGATTTDDPITAALYCLVGLGTGGLRNRQRLNDPTWIHYGGHFAHYPRNAIALEAMIASYFCLPARVHQFQGQWLTLARSDQSRMSARVRPNQIVHQQLGVDVVVGERVWSVENRFRVTLGPLDYRTFCQYMPDGPRLAEVQEMIRFYAGAEFDFDVQPLLRHDEVPAAQLASREEAASCRLGWNSWVQSRPRVCDADDAIFEVGVSS